MSASRRTCLFYLWGACIRSEIQNPGYDAGRRCIRLVALDREWDAFVDRAEAFALDEHEAARIWERRAHPALIDSRLCPVPSVGAGCPGPDGGVPILDCPHLFGTACLLAMPGCRGLCGLYRERGRG